MILSCIPSQILREDFSQSKKEQSEMGARGLLWTTLCVSQKLLALSCAWQKLETVVPMKCVRDDTTDFEESVCFL